MEQIVRLGVDLAKRVIQLHGVDAGERVVLRRAVPADRLAEFIVQLPPCVIAMEACSTAHHWARRFAGFGHTVRLIAPQFVTPYRKGGVSGKNDAADAEAICEAASRPSMRFVPAKNLQQQSVMTLHRMRQGWIEERTALINRLRGLLAEFGLNLPQRTAALRARFGTVAAVSRPVPPTEAVRPGPHPARPSTASCTSSTSTAMAAATS